MSELNIGQFIKNAFDYSTGKQPTQQPTKASNEKFQQAQNELMRQINQTVQNITQNFVRQQDIMMTQMQLKELTNYEKTMLLKNLFDFPSNIKDVAVFLAQDAAVVSAKELQLLMTQPLDISKILVMLQTNGKVASDKIAKMIATMNQSGMYNTQQLKEISVLVNACIPAADASPSQILKDFILMYLPWLPVNGEFDFNLGVDAKDGKNSSSDEDSITIIITTKNYGLIKVFLFKDEGSFNIDINCSEDFPKEKFRAEMNAESSENASVNAKQNIAFSTRKVTDEDKNKETKVEFLKNSKVTPELLILIHTVIKIVMQIDSQGVLEEQRKNNF